MTIEEKRRELFEAWQGEKADKKRYRRGPCAGMYKNPAMQNGWKCFNAALDAVAIWLPGKFDPIMTRGRSGMFAEDEARDQAIDDCRAAIESTGLGLKVLP